MQSQPDPALATILRSGTAMRAAQTEAASLDALAREIERIDQGEETTLPIDARMPVLLGDLLDEMTALIETYIVLPVQALATLISVWIANTYLFERFRYTGYPSLQSATPACGKSRLLGVIAACSKDHPQVTLIPTPAVLFRSTKAVLVLDEADKLRNADKETMGLVMAVLNAGYERGACVDRVERGKEGFAVKSFPVYGPKVLAGLEALTDALADRCFLIRMQRSPSRLPRLNLRKLESTAQRLRDGLAVWAEVNGDAVAEAYEGLPDELPALTRFEDRFQDIAEPLITLASVADSERPAGPAVLPRLLEGLNAASARREPSSREKELKAFLTLVRERLNGTDEVFLSTADLLESFRDVDGLERLETGKALAGFLKHFDLYRVSIGSARGYRIRKEWVEEWEKRYRA